MARRRVPGISSLGRFLSTLSALCLLLCLSPLKALAVGSSEPTVAELGVAKWVGPVSRLAEGVYRTPVKIRIENTGSEKLRDVRLKDAVSVNILPARVLSIEGLQGTGAEPDRTFDGIGRIELLAAGQDLHPGQSATIRFDLVFDSGGHPGPFQNIAAGNATERSGGQVIDRCSQLRLQGGAESDECQAALIELPEVPGMPVIGLAKTMAAPTPVDEESFEVLIRFVVQNFGERSLENVQVIDDLTQTFSGMWYEVVEDSFQSEGLSPDPGFDGAGHTYLLKPGGELAAGNQAWVSLVVRFSPTESAGRLTNQATARAEGTSDESTEGDDPDPNGDGIPDENAVSTSGWSTPEPLPVISVGLANDASSTKARPDGRFVTTLSYAAENFGEVPLGDLRIENDLRQTFTGAASFEVLGQTLQGSVPINPAFDGANELNLLGAGVVLGPGERLWSSVTVVFDPAGESSPFSNQAQISAIESESGRLVADLSTRGSNPDPDDDADPIEDERTPIPFEHGNARLELTKTVRDIVSTGTGFRVDFHLRLSNPGDLEMREVQVLDDLGVAFPAPVTVSVIRPPVVSGDLSAANGGFGPGDSALLSGLETLPAGGSAEIGFSVLIEPNGAEGPFYNQATAIGIDPRGETVEEMSDDEDEGGDDDPTPIDLTARVSLTVLRDWNHDRLPGSQDVPVEGWVVEVLNPEDAVVSTRVTDTSGRAELEDLRAGEYLLRVRNPENGVVWAERSIALQGGDAQALTQLVDPSGVVYASDSRLQLQGVVLALTDDGGARVSEACLLDGQQLQRTDRQGEYRFDLRLDEPGCPAGRARVHLSIEEAPEGFAATPSKEVSPNPEDLAISDCTPGVGLPCVVQPQNGPPLSGEADQYYLVLDWRSGDEGVANNHIPLDPLNGQEPPSRADLVVRHEVDRTRAVIGDVVGYASSVENLSDQVATDVVLELEPPAGLTAVADSLDILDPGPDGDFGTPDDKSERRPFPPGRRLVIDLGDLPSGGMRQARYGARVTPAVHPGIKISRATGLVGSEAADSAEVSLLIESDPLLDETTVIGTVFHDRDPDGPQGPELPDGLQGEGEPGLPGVRLVTLDGLVIETDKHGRYHVAAVDTGRIDRGTNFMIKLDTDTLPQGMVDVAIRRQVVRLTPGLMTRINFPVRTADRVEDVLALENRTDQFRFEPKLDILALTAARRMQPDGEKTAVRFAVFSNYRHHIRRYEITLYDVSDPRFVRQIPPYLPDYDRVLPSPLPESQQEKLQLDEQLRSVKGYSVHINDPEEDLFQSIPIFFPPEITRVAYRITAYGYCDPALGEQFDRTGLRVLDLRDAFSRVEPRQAREIFGHSNLEVRNIPVSGDRNLATRTARRVAALAQTPGGAPPLTEDIEPVPLPNEGQLAGKVLNATYGLVGANGARRGARQLEVDEEETWAVFDHEGLETQQRGFIEFAPERIVHAGKSPYAGYDDNARGVHRVLMTCGCTRVSAETIIDAESNGLSLRLTNFGELPEHPSVRFDGASEPRLLKSMPTQTTQEVFLGEFSADGINQTDATWSKVEVLLGVVDAQGLQPRFELKREVSDGEYAPELRAYCKNVQARPHTTRAENLLASMIVADAGEPVPPLNTDTFFAMGLINITAGANDVSGYIETLADDDHFDGDLFVDGRIAGYVKGKIRGKYLITAQIDTTEDALKNMGDNLQAKDPRRVFRQLDPDRYYPVYGDDSTTFRDVDSQGAMYLRVDWDKSSALWGNYNTGLTDTEFSQYNRSLYGAKLDYRTQGSNRYGDDTFALKVFGSEAQTASAHATYRATGGSLYYLPHRDIVQGSEKLWIEVRARDGEQVLDTEVLVPGRDYEVDDIQGRVILARPLAQVVRERANPIIRSQALEGDRVYLQVDYEHLPVDFATGDLTSGARGKWSGDRLSVGFSSITDRRDGTDYELMGTDLAWRLGQKSVIRAEFASSEASQNDLQVASVDGGLTFRDQQLDDDAVGGDAWGVEVLLDLAELAQDEAGLQQLIDARVAGELRAWHKEKEAGFSAGRLGEVGDYKDTGISIDSRVNQRFALGGSAIRVERGAHRQTIVRVQSEMEIPCAGNRCFELGFEGRYEDFDREDSNLLPGREGEAVLVGARLGREFGSGTAVYGSLQTAVATDDAYEDNDRFVVGVNQRMTRSLAVSLEGSDGDRGSALVGGIEYVAAGGAAVNLSGGIGSGATTQFGTRYTIADGREIYGTHTIDPDRTDGARNLTTLGQRSQLGSRTSVFNETTFGRDRNYADTAHVFGLDYELEEDLLVSASMQSSTLEAGLLDVERQAFSVGTSYRADGRRLASRLEYRRDSAEGLDTRQYLTSTRFGLGGVDSTSGHWLGKLNLAWTDNKSEDVKDGRFVELDVGYAYRPIKRDRWNVLARYAFLYDLGSNGQLGPIGSISGSQLEEKSHVLSAEVLYEMSGGFELGGKIAGKFGEQRLLADGDWYNNRLAFAAARGRYRLPGAKEGYLDEHWEVLAEYRVLKDFEDGGVRHGALAALYKSMQNGQIKVGVGYNFTDFDGDLTGTDYRSGGWFVDVIASY